MSRLPTLTPREVVAALKQAGFVEDTQSGSHLILKHPVSKRRLPVPIHAKDIKRPLMKAIIKQAGLTESQFRKLL
ncbi:MAG: type II toxin-antitoxin system HicA family toxin [Candidatus Hydrogenedentes bacterium]|nr:type II toxin-antitoxin system HicA family toxin [Candidatus Hydrogenedentota bacterium]